MKINRADEIEMIKRRKEYIKAHLHNGPMTCKHFKGNFYEIIDIVTHTETREELVIYKSKYVEPFNIWARPIDMFLSYLEEKYEEEYSDALYRMTLFDELHPAYWQIDYANNLKSVMEMKDTEVFAKSVRGEVFKIWSIIMSATPSLAVVSNVLDILNLKDRNRKLIPIAELFTPNFQIISKEELTFEQLVQSSQLSKQIYGVNGRF